MNVVRVKPGCQFSPLAPGGVRILSALDQVARLLGRDLEITCGSEAHPPTDPHTRGEAFDVSVHDLSIDQVLDVRHELQLELGSGFTVLYEVPTAPTDPRLQVVAFVNAGATAPHIHVQVKNGFSYPPIIPPAAARPAVDPSTGP